MFVALGLALLISAGPQDASTDRQQAEALARAGRNAEAIEIFSRIADRNPADVEARLWVGRLALRLGRTAEAAAVFRTVLDEHPKDVDARIGVGMVLTRTGAWRDALEVLRQAEPDAGENADLFAALARAHRRGGDDDTALAYFERARALSPNDPDIAAGFEAVARTSSHWLAVDGFTQGGAPGAQAASGWLMANVRLSPRVHVQADARLQDGSDYSDVTAGGGALWHAPGATTMSMRVSGGPGNVALPEWDASGEAIHYAGVFELGAGIRRLSFAGADIVALSPLLAWDREPWRLDARYTYSRSSFDETGETSGDHSVMLRETWQAWRRVALQGVYAYGIESFEDLTVDRVRSPGATTLAAGLRIDVPSLTRITATWEHQWRSNDTRVDRVTVSVVQVLR